jgi:diamine N-acetyltransferase
MSHVLSSILQYGGISLRAVEPDDAAMMLYVENDSDAWQSSDTLAPYSYESLRNYALTYNNDPFEAGQLRLIAVNNENSCVGVVDIYDISVRDSRAAVGIYILDKYRRHQYGCDALMALDRYAAITLGLTQLYAYIACENRASIALFEKAGFKCSGVLKKWKRIGHILVDVALYQKLL